MAVTAHITYVLDPTKLDDFERYGRTWIALVNRFGGQHHGYFLPSEGANNIGYALFTFRSLAEYERYRIEAEGDPDCQAAYQDSLDSGCIISFERTFVRPVLEP